MAETRVVITAEANQAIQEFNRLRTEATGSLQQIAAAGNQINRTGVSAAQTAQALRQVPAQFTDIVVSLQAGQSPLTVALQQGGQLRDMFGSAGAAARGLGGYVLGLINPYTVATAAAVGLVVANRAGAAEAEAYGRALALSGNAAGATANQMADAARNIGKVSGSQHEAAAVVAGLAGTGQVAVENLQRFGGIAVEVQHVVGRAVKETTEDFADLGKTPLSALEKINDKYHFVTAATYAQVKALQDQGRMADAANVAQLAYAAGVIAQKDKVEETLSDWERGWLRIKKAASRAADDVINLALGREATNSQKIDAAEKERELIEKRISVAVSKGDLAKEATFRSDLENNAKYINSLRDKEDGEKKAAKAVADGLTVEAARIKWLKDGDQYLTRAAQLERDRIVGVHQQGMSRSAGTFDGAIMLDN